MNNTDPKKEATPATDKQTEESIKQGQLAIKTAQDLDQAPPAEKKEEEQKDAEQWRNEG